MAPIIEANFAIIGIEGKKKVAKPTNNNIKKSCWTKDTIMTVELGKATVAKKIISSNFGDLRKTEKTGIIYFMGYCSV